MLEVTRNIPAGTELLVYYGPRDHRPDLYVPAWPAREYQDNGAAVQAKRKAKASVRASKAARARKGWGKGGNPSRPVSEKKGKAPSAAVTALLEGVDSNGSCSSSTANALREAGYRVDGSLIEDAAVPAGKPAQADVEDADDSGDQWEDLHRARDESFWLEYLRRFGKLDASMFNRGGCLSYDAVESAILNFSLNRERWTTQVGTAVGWARELMASQQRAAGELE